MRRDYYSRLTAGLLCGGQWLMAGAACAQGNLGGSGAISTTPTINIAGSVWTPNRDGSNVILATDWPQMPTNTWYTVGGSLTGHVMNDVIETPHYFKPPGGSGADSAPGIIAAWGGAAWDYTNLRMLIAGGGHGDSYECETGVYALPANTLLFQRVVDRTPSSQIQSWNFSTHALDTTSRGNASNAPLLNGVAATMHSYDGPVWLPPGTNGAGSTFGGLALPGNARSVVNLDNQVYQTCYWNNPDHDASDWSFVASFLDGSKIYSRRGSFYHARYTLSGTSATDWSSTSFGSVDLSGISSGTVLPYANSIWAQLRERREEVAINASSGTVRVRYGAAIDAAATDWTSYHDAITLTSSDGSHSDFNTTNLTDGTGTLLASAGVFYDHANTCLYVQANTTSGRLYKITGLSGTTWTTQYVGTQTALTGAGLGTWGRMRGFPMAGGIFLMRVTGINNPPEILRLS